MSSEKNIFDAFQAHDAADWQEAASAELQGGDPWKKLTRDVQGLSIKPFYTQADAPDSTLRLSPSQGAIFGPRTWFNCPRIVVTNASEANTTAMEALQSGADGIFFELKGPVDFKTLLKKIEWPYCSLNFLAADAPETVAKDFVSFTRSIPGPKPGAWYGSATFHLEENRGFHSSGYQLRQSATPSSDLASLFHQIKRGLEGKSMQAADVAICVELGTDFFVEIAKLRAIRQVWQRILDSTKLPALPLHVHGWSKPWNAEAFAPHGNMIRGTTAAMAAILGGCDVLTIDGDQESQELEQRIARNTAILLRDESRFSKVADPLAGSWFVDNLVDQLSNQVWDNIQKGS